MEEETHTESADHVTWLRLHMTTQASEAEFDSEKSNVEKHDWTFSKEGLANACRLFAVNVLTAYFLTIMLQIYL